MANARVVLHVGTPKSGTTYLQELLWANRPALADAGVLYPGEAPDAHFMAAIDLALGNFHGWRDPSVTGAWDRLVAAARAHDGTTVISHELLGDLTAEQAAEALADLDFAEVHLVLTVRDLARQLPAVWQEDLKNRHFLPFEDFIAITAPDGGRVDVPRPGPAGDEGHAATFWLRQDVPAVLRRWAGTLPADRVHVVTVPPAGSPPTLLWERFAEVLELDPAVAVPPSGRSNCSLGQPEAELLRRLNEQLAYGTEWPHYVATVGQLVTTVLGGRRSAPIRLPAGAGAWVSRHAESAIAELTGTGFRVVGDLADLRVHLPGPVASGAADDAAPVGADALVQAAVDAVLALLPAPAATPTAAEPPPSADVPAGEHRPPALPDDAAEPVVIPVPRAGAPGRRAWLRWRRPQQRSGTPVSGPGNHEHLVGAGSPAR